MIKYVVIDSNDNEFSFLGDSNASYQINIDFDTTNLGFIFYNKDNGLNSKAIYDFYSTIQNLDIKTIKIYYINEKGDQTLSFDLNNFENLDIFKVRYDGRIDQINEEILPVERIIFILKKK